MAYVRLAWVGPWVRVDSGGGRVRVRVRYINPVPWERLCAQCWGARCPRWGNLGNVAHGLGLVLGLVVPGHGGSRG